MAITGHGNPRRTSKWLDTVLFSQQLGEVLCDRDEQGDAMTKLSPKAMRFVDAAVTKSNSDQIRAVWNAYIRAPAKELSGEVARAALGALQQAERDLRNRLESSLGEDETADLSNDLGFIRAIKRDLTRSLEPTQRKG